VTLCGCHSDQLPVHSIRFEQAEIKAYEARLQRWDAAQAAQQERVRAHASKAQRAEAKCVDAAIAVNAHAETVRQSAAKGFSLNREGPPWRCMHRRVRQTAAACYLFVGFAATYSQHDSMHHRALDSAAASRHTMLVRVLRQLVRMRCAGGGRTAAGGGGGGAAAAGTGRAGRPRRASGAAAGGGGTRPGEL